VMGGKMAIGGLRGGVEPFIEQLAAPTAAPGGGSASAAAGAMAAALASMVAGMSRGKKAYVQHEAQHSEALARLASLREELKAAIDADSEAYKSVVAAFKAARDNPSARDQVNAATRSATLVPLSVAEKSKEVAIIVEQLRPVTNPKMASDLTVAASMARTAIEGALANVEINLEGFDDPTFVTEIRNRVTKLR
jgi:formiminotetrahydrofolate cyclodeaminase